MLLPRFEFHEPRTMADACRLMGELGEKARPLAGGTDLLVNMKKKLLAPEHLVSLGRIEPLSELRTENNGLRLGAGLTAAEIAESPDVKDRFPALAEGASRLGSPLIRNLATVAGNLASARPAADFPPPLIAYGARVVVRNASGEKTLPLEELFRGPGVTVLGPEDLMEAVQLDAPEERSGAAYLKLGVRQTLEISIVNVAAYLGLEDQKIQSARIVLGAVAPIPMRAPSAEKALIGEAPSPALFVKAAEAAAVDAKPIDDFRASAAYRRDMVRTLTRRALETALARIE
ncbi:MAG: xanthine dehydrogenase family protein subunit M [Desulfobacteraceae bacterium]